jgi:DNA-binding transcriptional LysR family regulator
MPRTDLNDIVAFLAVARERSFTRAAAQLGVSQSALSQTLRGLESRIGLRLLTRTTRSVAPTEAGERLLRAAGPHLEEIEAELAALSELRDKPSGTIRVTAHDHAIRAVLWPALEKLLPDYPDIKVEIVIDYGLTNIVAERYDAGISSGEMVAKDMVVVRIGPDMRSAVVEASAYFAKRPRPKTPQDLTTHTCINLRLPTHGGLYAREFAKGGRELRVRVEEQLVFNGAAQPDPEGRSGLP